MERIFKWQIYYFSLSKRLQCEFRCKERFHMKCKNQRWCWFQMKNYFSPFIFSYKMQGKRYHTKTECFIWNIIFRCKKKRWHGKISHEKFEHIHEFFTWNWFQKDVNTFHKKRTYLISFHMKFCCCSRYKNVAYKLLCWKMQVHFIGKNNLPECVSYEKCFIWKIF